MGIGKMLMPILKIIFQNLKINNHGTQFKFQRTNRQTQFFFSKKKKAWHGLGQIVQDYPNSKEALQFAGLDFAVCKRPNIHRLDDGKEIISNSSYLYLPP